ncbi:MAG TPA: glycosyltransferase [Azospirillum sp.]
MTMDADVMGPLRLLLDAVADSPGAFSQSLGEGFLDAYLAHGKRADLHWLVRRRSAFDALQQQAKRHRRQAHAKAEIAESLADDHHYSLVVNAAAAPRHLWWRDTFGSQNVNLVMLCGAEPAEAVERLVRDTLLAPLQPSDCLLCTSKAVMQELRSGYANYRRYITSRFAGRNTPEPAIAHLPQGIDAARYAAAASASKGRWGLGEDAVALVAHGGGLQEHDRRVALLTALGTALGMLDAGRVAGLHLLVDGPDVAGPLRALAGELGLPVAVEAMPGGGADGAGYTGADVALALPGTPGGFVLKAMACGVPVAGGDWGPYRDLVVPDKTGLLVPTYSFASGSAADTLVQGQLYGEPFGFAEQAIDGVAVVAPAPFGAALAALLGDGDRHSEMAAASRRRAATHHDWRNVIPLFDRLLSELASRHPKPASSDAAPFRVRRTQVWSAMKERSTQLLEPASVVTGRGGQTIDIVTALLDQTRPVERPGIASMRSTVLALANIFTAIDDWRLDELRTLLPKADARNLLPALRWLMAAGVVDVVAPAAEHAPQESAVAMPAPVPGAV